MSGAGTAAAGYLAYMGMSNIPQVNRMINQKVAYEGTSKALKLSDRAGTALEKQMYGDFADFNSGNPDIKTGESVASYRIKVGLLGPEAVRNQNTSRYYKQQWRQLSNRRCLAVHSHPTNAVAGPSKDL